jgi:hypothetical protein
MRTGYFAALGLALLAAGCGGSSSTAPSATPASTAVVAQRYLTTSAPVRAAYVTWKADLVAANGDVLHLTSQASAYAGVLTTFDANVEGIGATGKAATDIATLVADDNAVIADLDSLGSQTAGTEVAWDTTALADGDTAVAAGDTVRADLGLPPS